MSLPPGPSAPALIQTWHWLRRPYEFLDECAARYGAVFHMRIATFASVAVVSDPDLIKEVFAAPQEVLRGGQANETLRPFLGPNSVIVLDGPEHLRQRKLLTPALHGERLQAYGQTMLALAEESLARWPLGRPFPLQPQMQDITLQVILRTIFGVSEGPELERLSAIVRRGIEIGSNPLLLLPLFQRDLGSWSAWGRFQRMKAEADDVLRTEIARRRAPGAPTRDDVLAMLLEARDEDGTPMTFEELRDELNTMLTAGHETTATALAWTLSQLLRDRSLCQRLRDEVASAEEGGALVPERVARLELLDATVREGLRVRPVAPLVGRKVQRPLQLGGYDIPAGWVVAPSVYLAHRRPTAFPDADRFDPERFLRTRPAPTEWLPFGGGNRRCIGAAFATYEMKMVLAVLLLRADLQLLPGYAPRPVRRGVTLAPSEGVPVTLLSRSGGRA